MTEIENIKELLTEVESGIKEFRAGTLTEEKKERIKKNTEYLLENPKINRDQLIILLGLKSAFSYGLDGDTLVHTLYNTILHDLESDLNE